MITAARWVPKGAAAQHPRHAELDERELQRIKELANLELEDATEDLNEISDKAANPPIPAAAEEEDDDLKDFHMEDYDKELEEERNSTITGVRNLAYYENEEDDEYLTLGDDQDRKEEEEELEIDKSDNLLLTAKTEDDVSLLEVHVYQEGGDNLYVHHDVMLPSFPLCLEWLPITPNSASTADSAQLKPGNFVAIGTFEPEIEIWDLDVVDAMFPTTILGSFDRPDAKPKGTGKKKKKLKQANSKYHVDAVLTLASNRLQPNLLASGSADCTIKLWDLSSSSTDSAALSIQDYHKGKISSLSWNPSEASVLLSGGYDKRALVGDVRASDILQGKRAFNVSSDIESVKWDSNGTNFYVGTESGQVYKFDARQESKPVWTLQAHDAEISSFDINEYVDGLMITGSSDSQVKLWNVGGDKPSMVLSRDFDVGRVFSVGFGPDKDTRSIVSIGGSKGSVKVWDAFSNKAVRQTFNISHNEAHTDRILEPGNDDDSEESDRDIGDEELN
ncbi:rRNA-processing protein [Starmerella bacillaris]|uniref:rRNA-processing protein n=1 Tax=Starmerella bacillaris TaxID=1247836 RepID=A0AAV5RG57_STABA|nr:rRNA-processing protein [Starmerella bacillaris]